MAAGEEFFLQSGSASAHNCKIARKPNTQLCAEFSVLETQFVLTKGPRDAGVALVARSVGVSRIYESRLCCALRCFPRVARDSEPRKGARRDPSVWNGVRFLIERQMFIRIYHPGQYKNSTEGVGGVGGVALFTMCVSTKKFKGSLKACNIL